MPSSRLIDDILEIARIPAPTFDEDARIEWIRKRLVSAPGARERDETGNLLWTWGQSRPALLLAVHVDTVFPADTPLLIRRDGQMLTGPGVGDNAAAVATAINVVGDLLSEGNLESGAVAFTVGEEGLGNLRGATAACAALRPGAVIALEGHGLDRVLVDAVGSVRASVSVTGPGGHPWVDRSRPSAIHVLLQLGSALAARAGPECSINVGLVSGGRSVNTIADRAQLLVEMRSIEDPPLDVFIRDLGDLEAPPLLDISVDVLGRRPGGRLARDAGLLRTVREIRAELGLPDVLDAGSTDANAALVFGAPALALGTALGTDMHTLEEQIEAESLEIGCRQLSRVLTRLLGPDSAY